MQQGRAGDLRASTDLLSLHSEKAGDYALFQASSEHDDVILPVRKRGIRLARDLDVAGSAFGGHGSKSGGTPVFAGAATIEDTSGMALCSAVVEEHVSLPEVRKVADKV